MQMSIDIPTQATRTPEYRFVSSTELLRRDVDRLANINGTTPEIKKEGVYSIGEGLFLRATIIDTAKALTPAINEAYGSYFELSVESINGEPLDAFHTFELGNAQTVVMIDGNETDISNLSDQEIESYASDFRTRYKIDLIDSRKTL